MAERQFPRPRESEQLPRFDAKRQGRARGASSSNSQTSGPAAWRSLGARGGTGDYGASTLDSADAKQAAAEAALDLLPSEGVIGLGSGSTAQRFIVALGGLVAAGARYVGVPTSAESRALAESCGIPLLPDSGPWQVDVCVDGADEVSQKLDLIKGGGACHAREKVVNAAARRNVIVVDDSKLSAHLGERWPVPVEVLAFGWRSTLAALERLGAVSVRAAPGGEPCLTDAGNPVLDVACGLIEQPAEFDERLRAVPGVVATGLFVGRADTVLVAGVEGLVRLDRPAARLPLGS